MDQKRVWYDWPLILAYHSVSEHRQDSLAVSAGDFAAQMAWLQRYGFRSVTLAQYAQGNFKKGERIVVITFDDGYADNYCFAFPVLKQYGFVGTIFLVSDYVNTDHIFHWDSKKIDPQSDVAAYQTLRWDQVYEMAKYGIEFGSHTCTHPELTAISLPEAEKEIARSRQDLQTRLDKEIGSFCYPRGKLNGDVIQLVEKAGYRCAVVTPTRAGIPLGQYTLRRVGIYYNKNPWVFRLKVSPLLRRFYERLRWNSFKK